MRLTDITHIYRSGHVGLTKVGLVSTDRYCIHVLYILHVSGQCNTRCCACHTRTIMRRHCTATHASSRRPLKHVHCRNDIRNRCAFACCRQQWRWWRWSWRRYDHWHCWHHWHRWRRQRRPRHHLWWLFAFPLALSSFARRFPWRHRFRFAHPEFFWWLLAWMREIPRQTSIPLVLLLPRIGIAGSVVVPATVDICLLQSLPPFPCRSVFGACLF